MRGEFAQVTTIVDRIHVLSVGVGVLWLGMNNVLGCESFQPQAVRMKRMWSPSKIVRSSFERAPGALFGMKPDSMFDMDAIEALEKELEWSGTDTRAAEMKASSARTAEGGEDLDEAEGGSSRAERQYRVPAALHEQRIDAVLASLEPELSRSRCGTLIAGGSVDVTRPHSAERVTVTRKSERLAENSTVHVRPEAGSGAPADIVPEDLPLAILYEDEHMIVLNKAAGMVVHPGAGNRNGTVVNALAHYLAYQSPFGSGEFIGADGKVLPASPSLPPRTAAGVEGADGEAATALLRPGIVHRLDKGTTGVLVVAKTRQALSALADAFARRTVKKTYLAVTVGNPGERVVIDKPIGRHPLHRQRMRVVPDPTLNSRSPAAPDRKQRLAKLRNKGKSSAQLGRNALSFVDTLATDGKLSVVQLRIKTGRTHQIRVHLQDRTTPVYGDDVYGFADWNKRLKKVHGIDRPLLHAVKLEMDHPVSGSPLVFRAKMADDMLNIAKIVWPNGPAERDDLFLS